MQRAARRRLRLKGCTASALLLAAALFGTACGESPPPPSEAGARQPATAVRVPEHPAVEARRLQGASLLLISIDTLRADHVAPYGAAFPTAAAGRLAAEGVVFERAVAHVPLTLPSHSSMLTGLYPPRHGVRDNGGFVVDDEQVTLAERLAAAGYQTAAFVGSYVLDGRWGIDQGFELYDDRFDYHGLDSRSLGEVERPAETVVGPALEWLRNGRDPDRPFFLWVHLYDPHDPYEPPDRFRQRAPTPYAGEVMYADEQAGRLLDALDDEGLRDRTVVVYTSDHGEGLGDHGESTHSIFLYGTTLDVPLIVAPPMASAPSARARDGASGRRAANRGPTASEHEPTAGNVDATGDRRDAAAGARVGAGAAELVAAGAELLPPGSRVGGLARSVDLVPTALDLLGLEVPAALDGASLLPAVAALARRGAPATGTESLFVPDGAQSGQPGSLPGGAAGSSGDDELVGPLSYAESYYARLHYGWSELLAVQTPRWKYVRAPRPELYDLAADPGETENLAGGRPRLAALLAAELDALSPADASGAAPAPAAVDAETAARLRSLGYLGGGAGGGGAGSGGGPLPDPKDRMPLLQELLRAQRLEAAGELPAAAEVLEGLVQQDPDNPDVHFALASVRFKRRDFDGAIEEGRRTLALRPDYPIAVYNLALAYQAAGRLDEAVVGFERTLELEPGNLKALLSLGEVHYGRGDLPRARTYYERAAEAAPELSEVLVNLGNIALELGDVDAAERSLARAVEVGAEAPYLHFNLGLIAERRGDSGEALRQYRREVEGHPGGFKAWVNLGLLERQAGRLEAAVAAFERAAAAGPDEFAPPYLAAETLAGMGRLREALRWAEEAVRRAPADTRGRELRDRIRGAIGER